MYEAFAGCKGREREGGHEGESQLPSPSLANEAGMPTSKDNPDTKRRQITCEADNSLRCAATLRPRMA